MSIRKEMLIIAVVALLAGSLAAVDVLPERILSGYYGFNVLRQGDFERNAHMIDVLAANGFNSFETKIQGGQRECDIEPHVGRIKALADRARSKGMIFQIYLYTVPYLADRHEEWPEHAGLPPPVAMNGQTVTNAFLLTETAVWRQLFRHAFAFAAHQEEIGFAALKFDVERISVHVSFDDATWRAFCSENPSFSPSVPVKGRAAALASVSGGMDAYEAFFHSRVERAVEGFVRELRAIRPKIVLGYMPARPRGAYSEIFNRALAAPGIPMIADGWDMYNGSGYVDAATQANVARVKKGSPLNRYVTWLRPDNYVPDELAVAAYYAGAKTGGFSIWTLAMLDDSMPVKKRRYQLQKGFGIPDYMAAFARANAAVRADIAEGTLADPKRIPFAPPSMRVAPIDLAKITIPPLRHVAAKSPARRSLTLRDQQTLLIPRQAGEAIAIKLAHLSKRHHAALQYAVLDPAGRTLRNEAVTRGSVSSFSLPAPEAGTYALVVTGGRGGQAWYSVSINGTWALDARRETYLFGPQTFYVPGTANGNSALNLKMGSPRQEYVCRVDGGDAITNSFSDATHKFPLPGACVKLEFSRPTKDSYTQDFMISFPKGSAEPFIYPVPFSD